MTDIYDTHKDTKMQNIDDSRALLYCSAFATHWQKVHNNKYISVIFFLLPDDHTNSFIVFLSLYRFFVYKHLAIFFCRLRRYIFTRFSN